MELSSQEVEIPMPINSVYGGVHNHGHGHGHDHMTHNNYQHQDHPSSSTSHNHNMMINNNNPNGSNSNGGTNNNGTSTLNLEDQQEDQVPYINNTSKETNNPCLGPTMAKKHAIKYRECQKNHAATMGGNAFDGCGEFMPNGDEGTLEALTCSACNCHRNFHRKEVDDFDYNNNQQFYLSTPHPHPHPHPHHILSTRGRKVILGSGGSGGGFLGYPTGVGAGTALIPVSRALPINVPYQVGPAGRVGLSDDHHGNGNGGGGGGVMVRSHQHQMVKRRIRTKFSQEQKEKMLEFAEKVGWKIQKQEESVVQQICQEVGVKRRVLKVWMHNNKHTTLAKKINNSNISIDNDDTTSLIN